MALPIPPWVQLVLMVYVPIYILNAFVSFPFEWLVVILVRGLFEFTLAKPIRRGVSLLLTTLAWYFIAPRVGAGSLLLNAIVHCYMVRQAAGLTDLPNPMGNMPPTIRGGTVFIWLVLVCIDVFLRNVSTSYPKYAAIAAAFALLGVFDVMMAPPEQAPSEHSEAQTEPRVRGTRRRR